MDKPTITKQELLRKLDREWKSYHGQKLSLPDGQKMLPAEEVAEYTARALGYTVTDEPAFPERLCVAVSGAFVDAATGDVPVDERWESLRPELAHRYNAKAAVLEIAEELDGLVRRYEYPTGELSRRLRAAYESP